MAASAPGDALRSTVPAADAGLPGHRTRSLTFTSGTGGFASEIDAHLRDRLRLGTGFMGAASFLLFLVGRAAHASSAGRFALELDHPSVIVHLASCAVAVACWAILRRGGLSGAGLRAVDAVVVLATVASAALIHAFSYATGALQVVPFLALFLIARAVVVPSTSLRTLLLSAPALPAILAVQAAHGEAFGFGGQRLRDEAFVSYVVWDQAVLGFATAVAVLASRVNFALRRKAWEARQVDRYVLEERIGVGAMGEVYRARHGLLRRPTALKLLRPDVAGEGSLARFEHEVRQTARLTHPNTIAIYDFGTTDDGEFYYAMELLDGADLDRIVAAAGPLPPERVIHVLSQVCAALAEAHGIGLIHRDLKPANVVLCRRGGEADVAKVMDFGLVKDLRDGTAPAEEGIAGTPLTMAPEMILRRPLTPAADLYAVGALGHFLLTGRPLFDADGAAEFLMKHVNEEPAPPSARVPGTPPDLEGVLMDCLRKAPADRPPSAAAIRARLRACAAAAAWTPDRARSWWEEHGGRFPASAAAAPVP